MSSEAYFNQVAEQWDTMRQSFFSEGVREEAYRIAGVVSGRIAADIGCGSGFMTEGLLNMGAKVVAVDQSKAMLDQLSSAFDTPDLLCLQGESEALPMEEDTVDYVFANMYLHHVESPGKAILEMARVLKPGGKLVITDLNEHQFTFLKEEHHDRWLGFKRDSVCEWLTEAGLNGVNLIYINQECRAESKCGSAKAEIKIFAASGSKQ